MLNRRGNCHTEIVNVSDASVVLDRNQLREITLEDEDMMRQLLAALIEDTEQQIPLLELAIAATDTERCARLAHYSKGACSNLGAIAAANVLTELELSAKQGALEQCSLQLLALGYELDRLRVEEV
jgi:HPt (histidine-containing phosphotransfer) domain-containing protein